MRKILKNAIVLFCVFFCCSCSMLGNEEIIYTYDGMEYTDTCEYGYVKAFWDIRSPIETRFETIVVEGKGYQAEAKIIQGDSRVGFFFVNESLYIKKETSLPNIEDNFDEIDYIEFDFLDKGTLIVDNKNEISRLVDIMNEADNKTRFEKDISYSYDGNVYVFFEGFSLRFFAGRLIVDQGGRVYFSSSINPMGLEESMRKSWYSEPLNTDMETIYQGIIRGQGDVNQGTVP